MGGLHCEVHWRQSSSGLLQACGFELDLEDGPEGSDGNAFAVLPEDADLLQLKAAVSLLGGTLSGQTQKAGPGEQALHQLRLLAASSDAHCA